MFFKLLFWTLFIGLTLFCVSWFGILIVKSIDEYELTAGAAAARSKMAEKDKSGPIVLGVTCNKEEYPGLYYGAKFAVGKINGTGGIDGRKIRIAFKDNKDSAEEMLQVTQEFCDDLNITAVIGPEYSTFCEIATPNLEYYGILQISPLATAPDLTKQGFSKFFRNIPNDRQLVEAAAKGADILNWKNIAIIYFDDSYSGRLAAMLANELKKYFIKIPVREKFSVNTHDKHMKQVFKYWEEHCNFDAVFVVSRNRKNTERTIQQLQQAEIKVPIMLDFGSDIQFLKHHSAGASIYTPAIFIHNSKEFKNFANEYEEKMKRPLSPLAVLSSEAVELLAAAIKECGTSDPVKVAEALKKIKRNDGITGEVSFKENGDINRDIMLLKIKDEELSRMSLDGKTMEKFTK